MCNKMSDVRLSNASPTVERVDARLPDTARPPVRRTLFGTPDPEEIRSYLDASIQGEVQSFTDTYNFDPVNERPLSPRNYDWQEDRDAPEFYVREPHGRQRPQREDGTGRRDAEDRPPDSTGARKRRSGASGSCDDETQSKRSHTDDDDDDDDDEEDHGAGSQAVNAVEERLSRPEESPQDQ
ncbi:cyclin-dependent kinase inhibitor 1B-like [Anoplopoma fimbria]|uniref:cyclin-dependent kinase inhibitor 1B-like n=1 Tax=Anoplopoma fimbria TaxID=229290 RepID=UPI0023ED97CF|nr:cyclin-dependent kinase inhibitor 1B-like [Anoplopoma fimbria]